MKQNNCINILMVELCDSTYNGVYNFIKDRTSIKLIKAQKPFKIEGFININKKVDLYIIDVSFFDLLDKSKTGYDLIYSIRKKDASAKILVYTLADRVWNIQHFIRLKINGAVHKSSPLSELVNGIDSILAGEEYYCPRFSKLMSKNNRLDPDSYMLNFSLSDLEVSIIRYAAEGMTSKEIASKTNKSINTITDNRKRLFLKFGVNTMEELLVKALTNGFPLKCSKNVFKESIIF